MSKKILIIDDDQEIVESIKIVLESKNYEVIFANSAKVGLEKANESSPDLIILDVMMEKSNSGFEVARELKGNDKSKNIPILMLTAIKDQKQLDFKDTAGDETWLPVDEYCDKPLKSDDLVAKVEKLLE